MSTLPLPGLKGADPIGFLAAVGLLRVLTGGPFGVVKLAWSDDSGWSAILSTESACDEEGLIAALTTHMSQRAAASAFNGWGEIDPDPSAGPSCWLSPRRLDDVKVPVESYRQLLSVTRSGTRMGCRETAEFYSGLGSELITLGNKDVIKPSALHMTSGNQAFLESARELALSLDPNAPLHPKAAVPAPDAFREAVFACDATGETGWKAADEFSAMGFDPAREAVYALTATAPTSTGPRSTRAAVWLAIEALPLFPVLPVKGRLHTRAFDHRATGFRWPIWDGALTADSVRTALGLPELFDADASPESLSRLAIRAVMGSERVTIGQGYGQLRPADRIR